MIDDRLLIFGETRIRKPDPFPLNVGEAFQITDGKLLNVKISHVEHTTEVFVFEPGLILKADLGFTGGNTDAVENSLVGQFTVNALERRFSARLRRHPIVATSE